VSHQFGIASASLFPLLISPSVEFGSHLENAFLFLFPCHFFYFWQLSCSAEYAFLFFFWVCIVNIVSLCLNFRHLSFKHVEKFIECIFIRKTNIPPKNTKNLKQQQIYLKNTASANSNISNYGMSNTTHSIKTTDKQNTIELFNPTHKPDSKSFCCAQKEKNKCLVF